MGFGAGSVLTCSQTCGPQSTEFLFGRSDKSSVRRCFLEMLSSGACWSIALARPCLFDGLSLVLRGSSGAWRDEEGDKSLGRCWRSCDEALRRGIHV